MVVNHNREPHSRLFTCLVTCLGAWNALWITRRYPARDLGSGCAARFFSTNPAIRCSLRGARICHPGPLRYFPRHAGLIYTWVVGLFLSHRARRSCSETCLCLLCLGLAQIWSIAASKAVTGIYR